MNTDIVTKTIYHCPCCREPMSAITSTFEYPTRTVHVVNVTCWRKSCAFFAYTVSPDRANSAKILATEYHVIQKYDVFTGGLLNEQG